VIFDNYIKLPDITVNGNGSTRIFKGEEFEVNHIGW
jgi:hypothetical protein